jgi:hypothetical protein
MKRIEFTYSRKSDPIVDAALIALKPDQEGQGLVPPLDELSERRITDRIFETIDRSWLTSSDVGRRSLHVALSAVVLVCVLGALGVGYVLMEKSESAEPVPLEKSAVQYGPQGAVTSGPELVTDRGLIPDSRFFMISGEVTSGDARASDGSRIPSARRINTGNGRTSLALPDGVTVGLAEQTSIRVLWDGKKQYGLSLMNGMALISVEPYRSQERFFVDTPAGTVRVKGTLFTVVVSHEDGVFVELHRGRVEVERLDGETDVLSKRGDLVQLSGKPSDDRAIHERIQDHLQALKCSETGETFTELRHFECLGPEARPKVAGGVGAHKRESKFVRHLSIRDLMNLARSQKSDGNWAGAAESYRELLRQHSASDEARTSLVSLGQIELEHLDNPKAALGCFSRYLKRPGPLTQEAMFGKTAAYRALGDAKSERKFLERFLDAYPMGVKTTDARKRLAELDKEEASISAF